MSEQNAKQEDKQVLIKSSALQLMVEATEKAYGNSATKDLVLNYVQANIEALPEPEQTEPVMEVKR